MTSAVSVEQFLQNLERDKETRQALENPMLGALNLANRAFAASAELAPTALGKGGVWDIPSKMPLDLRFGKGFEVEAKPEAVEAFREFVSPTEGAERPSFGRTFRTLEEAQEERPLSEQLVTGILDPVGTVATGGLGVTKGVRLGGRLVSKLLGTETPAITKALARTSREAAVGTLDESIRAATRAEDWDEVFKLSQEQQRLNLPGVGEGVTGMSRRWAEDVRQPPRVTSTAPPPKTTPLWEGRPIPEGPSKRWIEEVEEIPYAQRRTERWRDEVAYPTEVPGRPVVPPTEPPVTTPRWRGEPIPEGPSPRWIEEVEEIPYAQGRTERWRDVVAYPTKVPGRPLVPDERTEKLNELFSLPVREETRDAAGRLANRFWADETPAVQRAAEQTGEVIRPREQAVITPPEQAGWFRGGIQPSDVGETVMPIREQLLGAVKRPLGRAVRALWGGPGFKIEDTLANRADEIQYSWLERFGDDSEKVLTFALRDALKKARTIRKKEIEVMQSAERSRRVGAGMSAAARGRTPEEMHRAYTGQQAGEMVVRSLNPDDFLEELGQEGIDTLVNIVHRAGVIGEAPGAARTPDKILSPWHANNAFWAIKNLLNDGVIPTNSNIRLLEDVFGDGVASELIKRRTGTIFRTGYKPNELFLDIINMPRANISSFDLSFLLRQGGMLFPGQLREVSAAAELAMRAIAPGGENVARIAQRAMMEVDNGVLWDKYVGSGGLFIHGVGRSGRLMGREEAFLSALAGKAFPWVRASERGYATFLSKLRWDVMDDMVKRYEGTLGRELDPSNVDDLKVLTDLGSYLNSMTGRGPMPTGPVWDTVSAMMNALLFSPRLFTSRIAAPVQSVRQMRGFIGDAGTVLPRFPAEDATSLERATDTISNTLYPAAVAGDEAARSAYRQMSRTTAKQMGTWFVTGSAILTLAALGKSKGGMPIEVGTDWRSSDFGKIVAGKSRYDIWSGYTQIARAVGQLVEGESKSAQTGEVRPKSRIKILGDFTRSKFAPTVGIVRDYNLIPWITEGERWTKGTGFFGEDRDIIADIKRLPVQFVKGIPLMDEQSFWTQFMGPLFLRDLSDAIEEEMQPLIPGEAAVMTDQSKQQPGLVMAAVKAVPPGIAAVTGMGVTTFQTKNDIAEEISGDLPGGPYTYLQLQPFEQDLVDDISNAREAERGTTRTQGIGARLDEMEADEVAQYEAIIPRLPEMTVRDVRDEYYRIKNNFRIRRNQMLEDEFGPRDDEELQRLRREGMGPVRQRVEDFYTLQRKAEDMKGMDLNYEEYESLLNDWETRMTGSKDPLDTSAVIMVRMNAHRTEIPDELLRRLSENTQRRYSVARNLRERYRGGELRQELYGQ